MMHGTHNVKMQMSLLSTRCIVGVQNGLTVTENGESTTESKNFISLKNLKLVSLLYFMTTMHLTEGAAVA